MMLKSFGHVKPTASETNRNKEVCTHGARTFDAKVDLGLHVHPFVADLG